MPIRFSWFLKLFEIKNICQKNITYKCNQLKISLMNKELATNCNITNYNTKGHNAIFKKGTSDLKKIVSKYDRLIWLFRSAPNLNLIPWILPAANLRLENPRLLQPLQPDQNYCIIKMTKFSKKNFKKFEICKKLLNCFTA